MAVAEQHKPALDVSAGGAAARRHPAGAPPIRWWVPALVFVALGAVLKLVVLRCVGNPGPISGTALLTAVQGCFLSLSADRRQRLCDQARVWPGSLAELVSQVSGGQSAQGVLPTFSAAVLRRGAKDR